MAFAPSPGWLDWNHHPSAPAVTLPPGAVDAHVHVFGPGHRFPYAPERRYTPTDASREDLAALHHRLGFDRTVIVQGTAHGTDNRAMVDALRAMQGRARGVATVRPDVSAAEITHLHEAGVRGVRLTFIERLGAIPSADDVERIVGRIAPHGWHVVLYVEATALPRLGDLLLSLPVPLVFDHMGVPDVSEDPHGPRFDDFLAFLRERSDLWCKVNGADRLTRTGPYAVDDERQPYADVTPFAQRVITELPDRVMWGTDWPHPNLSTHMPDDGRLVDWISQVAPSAEHLHRLLVDNPARLYWPD